MTSAVVRSSQRARRSEMRHSWRRISLTPSVEHYGLRSGYRRSDSRGMEGGDSVETVLAGIIGGVVSAALVGGANALWRWLRRPVLHFSSTSMTNHWSSDARMASLWLSAANSGKQPAVGVELEVSIPQSLYPRDVGGSQPVRFEAQGGATQLLTFVAHRDDPLYPAPAQTLLRIALSYNSGGERPSGRFEFPVVVRAANARERRDTCVLELP